MGTENYGKMQNILVSIDFNDNEQFLLEKAAQFGQAFSAKLWLVHIGAPDPDFVGHEVGPQYIRDAKAEDLRKEHRLLQNYAERFVSSGLQAEGLLVQGATVDTLLEQAQKLKIDMIIIGQHEHGFFYKIFQESVSAKVAKKSHIPVLLVPLEI